MLGVTLGGIVWTLMGLVLMVVLWRVGIALLRAFTTPLPPPLPADLMRWVSLRHRCDVCGVELRLTMALDEDLPPLGTALRT